MFLHQLSSRKDADKGQDVLALASVGETQNAFYLVLLKFKKPFFEWKVSQPVSQKYLSTDKIA